MNFKLKITAHKGAQVLGEVSGALAITDIIEPGTILRVKEAESLEDIGAIIERVGNEREFGTFFKVLYRYKTDRRDKNETWGKNVTDINFEILDKFILPN